MLLEAFLLTQCRPFWSNTDPSTVSKCEFSIAGSHLEWASSYVCRFLSHSFNLYWKEKDHIFFLLMQICPWVTDERHMVQGQVNTAVGCLTLRCCITSTANAAEWARAFWCFEKPWLIQQLGLIFLIHSWSWAWTLK